MKPNFLNANMPPIAAVIAIKEVSAPHCTAPSSSTLDANSCRLEVAHV